MEILSVGIPEHELRKPLAHLRELLEGVDLNVTYAETLDVAREILSTRSDIALLFLGDGDRSDYEQLLQFSAEEAREIPAIILAYEMFHTSLGAGIKHPRLHLAVLKDGRVKGLMAY